MEVSVTLETSCLKYVAKTKINPHHILHQLIPQPHQGECYKIITILSKSISKILLILFLLFSLNGMVLFVT